MAEQNMIDVATIRLFDLINKFRFINGLKTYQWCDAVHKVNLNDTMKKAEEESTEKEGVC